MGAGRRHRARAAHGVGGGDGDAAGRGVAGDGGQDHPGCRSRAAPPRRAGPGRELDGAEEEDRPPDRGAEEQREHGADGGTVGRAGGLALYALKGKDLVNPLAVTPSSAPALVTDFMHQIAAPQWDWHGRALFRVSKSPLPYTITGVVPDVAAGG